MATKHDLAESESYQLFSRPGWQTLEAIIQSTGENIPTHSLKRPRPPSGGGVEANHSDSPAKHLDSNGITNGEPDAKRFAALRLSGNRQRDGKNRPRAIAVPRDD